jgi:hypothetical protein
MMSFKRHLFAMGSVIALMTGAAPAFAYNNKAYISQPGDGNYASQDQTGQDNLAHVPGVETSGTSVRPRRRTLVTQRSACNRAGPSHSDADPVVAWHYASPYRTIPALSPNVAVPDQSGWH